MLQLHVHIFISFSRQKLYSRKLQDCIIGKPAINISLLGQAKPPHLENEAPIQMTLALLNIFEFQRKTVIKYSYERKTVKWSS